MSVQPGATGIVTPFSDFCLHRISRALLPSRVEHPHHMLVLGVSDGGSDARKFADNQFVVEAVDEDVQPVNYGSKTLPGAVKFFKSTLTDYFRMKDVRQSTLHSVYACRLFDKLHVISQQEVLIDAHYMLRPGGWFMLEVAHKHGGSDKAVDTQVLIKRVLVEGCFKLIYFDLGEFGSTRDGLIARFILER